MMSDENTEVIVPKQIKWGKGLLYATIMSIVISMPLLIHQMPEIINALSDYNCKSEIKINKSVQSYNIISERIA
jgi:hypothetical protein